ncbi:hypothetical protein SK128_012186 [Halocaridina rubra]|uniref:Uncharacterized protein n=1 Tax=Halocaridina rubra TaxID=373956 RepID=A0AAN8WBH1_HALRR
MYLYVTAEGEDGVEAEATSEEREDPEGKETTPDDEEAPPVSTEATSPEPKEISEENEGEVSFGTCMSDANVCKVISKHLRKEFWKLNRKRKSTLQVGLNILPSERVQGTFCSVRLSLNDDRPWLNDDRQTIV